MRTAKKTASSRLVEAQVTEDANLALTAVRRIAANRVSDAQELRHPIFAHREHKSVGRTSDQADGDHRLSRSVSCGFTNHRAIVSDARAACLSARPKMAAYSARRFIQSPGRRAQVPAAVSQGVGRDTSASARTSGLRQ